LRDVASKAEVSFQTAGKVLNGKGSVSALTRERILDAANTLGYISNVLARRPDGPAETCAAAGPSGVPRFVWRRHTGCGQTVSKGGVRLAKIKLDLDRSIGRLDRRVFGGFIEHLGRCIYGGVFDENSPLSDERGYRRDVLEAAKNSRIPILRWPGGNFRQRLPLDRRDRPARGASEKDGASMVLGRVQPLRH
jgi:hypothetical protein